MISPPAGGILVPLDVPGVTAEVDRLSVIPGPKRQEDSVVGGVLGFDRAIDGGCPVNVLRVPQRMDDHDGNLERLPAEDSVHRLALPEAIVRRMLGQL